MPGRVLSSDPNAGTPVGAGRPSGDEGKFRSWYHQMSRKYDLNPDPDSPDQFYDYRAAFRAGAKPDKTGHWPSDFKKEGHPALVVGGFHVQTGERVPGSPRAKDAAELVRLGWDQETAARLAAMPEPASRRVLSSDPAAGEPVQRAAVPALAGRQSELRQGKPQSAWSSAWDSVRESIFGSPERAEAKATGVGLTPTLAELGDAALAGASFMGGPGLMAKGARALAPKIATKAPRAVAAVQKLAEANPRITQAVLGGLGGSVVGDENTALIGAALGAMSGGRGRLPSQAPPAAAAPSVGAVVDRGRAAAAGHNELMAFAKKVAAENPKVGEKIWMLLDDAGKPLQRLTPDQAGAAARAGRKTTWVKNLWR